MLLSGLVEIIDSTPHSAPLNMAIDEALLRTAQHPTLRIYSWSQAAVSFGYFGKFSEATILAGDRELVRRWTGGGMVEHGSDLTYTLVVPRIHAFQRHSAPESYRLIHEAIARLLTETGHEIRVAEANAPSSNACFSSAVQFDLLEGSRKIAGAAQRRTRWGLLHQGSIQATGETVSLRKKLARAFCTDVVQAPLSRELEAAAHQIAATRYADDAWLRKF